MNPFVFSGASNLTDHQILDMFIDDHNYSRLIESKKNVFLWGERGSGKSMSLLYSRLNLRKSLYRHDDKDDGAIIPIYIPCITPLTFKREYLLLDDSFKAAVISEHLLVISIAIELVDELSKIPKILDNVDQNQLCEEIEYVLNSKLPKMGNLFEKIKLYLKKECIESQKKINKVDSDAFYNDTYSFSSLILTIIETFSKIPKLSDSHYLFMVDDAHDLNHYQRETINSWVSFRDNSRFSFKISTAKSLEYNMLTATGGAILDGHDYSSIDMEKPYQSSESSFGKLAEKIIQQRLNMLDINKTTKDFFEISKSFETAIVKCKQQAKNEIKEKTPKATQKQINDHVYKYARAIYFRSRSRKANRPPYSGFDTIVHLSSGVIRNLLEPCYLMYDDAQSNLEKNKSVQEISARIQEDVISRSSEKLWKILRDGLDKRIVDCSHDRGKQIYNLFDSLAKLFRKRLFDESCSEPRIISFIISAENEVNTDELYSALEIAIRAQLLYKRSGNSKDDGKSVDYYVPNRMLWPDRGLDPVGQHGRLSLKAKYLVDALKGKNIPYKIAEDHQQVELPI